MPGDQWKFGNERQNDRKISNGKHKNVILYLLKFDILTC